MERTKLGVLAASAGYACALVAGGACSYRRQAIDVYPERCLKVVYEPASGHSSCLIAAVVMAANYVAGSARLSEREALKQMRADRLDETRPADVKTWLEGRDAELTLFTFKGDLTDRPPLGVQHWLLRWGYPVVCIINKSGQSADYNHAVVVIGMDLSADDKPAMIHYLDPASLKRVEAAAAGGRGAFEEWWRRGENFMAVVVKKPRAVSMAGESKRYGSPPWQESIR